jgi:hypothetical protein
VPALSDFLIYGTSAREENMRICVFTGSGMGARDEYKAAAEALGTELGQRGIGLVYGGASVGLMGVVATAALQAGGEVTGILPKSLADLEIAHEGLSELIIVSSMHERKAHMADMSDAFIAMPGGIGTLEETFEMWTWSQLGIHRKPLGLLNAAGYYDGLMGFLDHVTREGFVRQVHRDIMLVDDEPGRLIDRLALSEVPLARKGIDPKER